MPATAGSSPTKIVGCAPNARPASGRIARRPRPIARPRGRLREREYWRFCLDHVREYNHTYNFFAGMSAEDIVRYQKEAVIGHRPTWKMGMNGGRPTSRSYSSRLHPEFGGADDPFGIFQELGGAAGLIGERVRDKIAASKRKGIWVGGPVPLGYAAVDKKILVLPAEAEAVRTIFARYLQLGSIRALAEDLGRRGIRSKRRRLSNGRTVGGQHFGVGARAMSA
jgi:hypothetical protein